MSDTAAPSPSPNAIAGTWRLVSSQVDQDGTIIDVFGPKPGGLLVFTEDLHFVEVLRDTTVPGFASDDRTEGTPDENATAVAGALGQYGTYTVTADGEFAGNTIDGSTFPNWSGLTRDTTRLRFTLDGDTLTEHLTDPGAAPVTVTYRRV